MRDAMGGDPADRSIGALLVGLTVAYLGLYLPFLDQVPPIVTDESWYANTAHNLASGQGLINTNAGARGGDQFFAYPLIVSGAFKVFGTSLWVGRFVSILIGLFALWGWALLGRRLALRGWPFAIICVLFVTSNVYYILFRRLRPEALVIALSVWALYFFATAWQTGKLRPGMMCALLAGGSVLAHPYGALLAVLLGILLAARVLFNRDRTRSLIGYAAGGVSTILIFSIGWGLLREQSLLDFLREGISSGRLSVGKGTIASAFWMNLTTFVPAYSLGLKRLYILVFELGVLFAGLARYRHDKLTGLLSLSGLVWFMTGLMLLTPFQRWAFCVVLIFSLLVTGRLLSLGMTTGSLTGLRGLWLATLLYGLNNLAGNGYVLSQNSSNTSYSRLTQTLDAAVPDGVPVLTHIEFWFAFQNNRVYTPFMRWRTTPYSGFQQLQESRTIRYAVLSAAFARGFSPTTGEKRTRSRPGVGFYQQAHAYALAHCERIAVVSTNPYGEIEIWECPPRPKMSFF